jgi:sulfonate transport system ATP-binding protein
MHASAISLQRVSKRFDTQPVLHNVSIEVMPGEVVSLVGPSGCGKSTLLRLLANLESGNDGQLLIDGQPVVSSHRLGLMFQEPRLFPWLTVRQNALFGLHDASLRSAEARIDALLESVGLHAAAGQLPKQLSGGMAQRAALARALIREPRALLLDEPFSAVDAITRLSLQDLLLETHQRTRLTMLLVTHDLDEALILSDRVYIFSNRPATVTDIISVTEARPRDRNGAGHVRLRSRLFEALHLAKSRNDTLLPAGTPFGV